MIRVFCDKCGKEIDHNKEGINVDFNHYGVVKFRNNEESKEFQYAKHVQMVCIVLSKVKR